MVLKIFLITLTTVVKRALFRLIRGPWDYPRIGGGAARQGSVLGPGEASGYCPERDVGHCAFFFFFLFLRCLVTNSTFFVDVQGGGQIFSGFTHIFRTLPTTSALRLLNTWAIES